MKNKNILVITPFFAPETHAAVFRAHKLVKYLKREGWNPIVLTVDKNYIYNENTELLEELEGVEIIRTRYIEPTIRGIKMWLTGKDLTYSTLKKKGFYKKSGNDISKKKKDSLVSECYKYLLDNFLNSPDRYWTWRYSATKEAKGLIEKYGIDIVYTSSSPYTTLQIGIELKTLFPNLKWVADYRDPLTYTLRNHSHIFSVFKKQKQIEIKALDLADAIIGLASSYKLIYHDLYNGKYDDKTFFIPTGVDDDLIPSCEIYQTNEILYVGEYLVNYGKTFLDYFRGFQQSHPELANKLKLTFIGAKDINQRALRQLGVSEDFIKQINFEDHMPQSELYKKIKAAKASVLAPGHNSHWWTNFAKMVDYIALKSLVLAVVPNPSEARTQLSNAGLGLFLDSQQQAESVFCDLVNNKQKIQVNEDFCKAYLASSQVQSFIKIFKGL